MIAHWITPAVCLDRQRHNYHKCFACQYRGLGADAKLAGPPRASPPETTPRAVPVRKATSKKPAKVAPQVR